MIRIYLLPVETVNGTEQVAGIDFIHDALLDATADPLIRLLIMNTTPEEHTSLVAVATDHREAIQAEIDRYNTEVIIIPPDPDYDRACELLETSPAVITQPEQWELLRLFGKKLGYRFE